MSTRTWKNIDKSAWDQGPWIAEPDKASWIDEATGLDCLIVRNHFGALCGYVGVPPEHPWHGRDYEALGIDVHGGLTYCAFCDEHAEEGKGICHIPEPGRPADVWWFGFDCAHFRDRSPRLEVRERELDAAEGREPIGLNEGVYRDFPYVEAEVASLARQLAGVA